MKVVAVVLAGGRQRKNRHGDHRQKVEVLSVARELVIKGKGLIQRANGKETKGKRHRIPRSENVYCAPRTDRIYAIKKGTVAVQS